MLASKKEVGKRKGALSPTVVIVRAFEGEPVTMEAVGMGPQFVTVRRPGSSGATVRFSYDVVYMFELVQYRQLVKAFTSGDRETLDRLWQSTPRIR
jgi:hypothetical protein